MAIALYETVKGKLTLVAVSIREGMEHYGQTVGLITNRKYRQLRRQGVREADIRVNTPELGDVLLEQFA